MSDTPPNTTSKRLRFLRWFRNGLLLIVSIFAVAIIVGESEAFKHCKDARKNQNEYAGLYERSGIFGGKIVRLYTSTRLSYVCTWHFTEKNEGALVALATIALCFFTYTLWRATIRLGDLATTQSLDMQKLLTAARDNATAAAQQAEAATQQHAALREQARETAAIVEATKAANDLTNRIFLAEQRPWVNIQDIAISPTTKKEEWEFDVAVGNTGGSPAHFVRVSILKVNKGDRPHDVVIRELGKIKAVRRAISITVFPHERRQEFVYLNTKIEDLLRNPLVVVVEYEFVAGRTEHITGGTIFCMQRDSVITYRRIPMYDVAT